jgi:hypothetical protein
MKHSPLDLKLVSVKLFAFGLALPTFNLGFCLAVSNYRSCAMPSTDLKILLFLPLLASTGAHLVDIELN